jgi:hypothetical protein
MRGEHLYIIQMSCTGAFKVGRSGNVPKRLKQLQTSCPHKLKVLLVAEGQGHLERSVHQALRSFQTRGQRGEWFSEEGIGSIPVKIWDQVPVEILEDPDWWKSS